jgi:A/G-specific adenine glycosylase
MHNRSDANPDSVLDLDSALMNALDWWYNHGRDFPWRRTKDPFKILVAELLLQRSRSGSVSVVYQNIFQRWPTPKYLSRANISSIESVIRPLGLQSRAMRIKELAIAWVGQDHLPSDVNGLQKLSGIGPYSAKATAVAMSWNPEPPVDSVSGRVMRRLLGYETAVADYDTIASTVYSHTPKCAWRALNWAILDIAAAWCMPKKPRCTTCPLRNGCRKAKSP